MLPAYLLTGMIAPTPFWWAVSLLVWTGALLPMVAVMLIGAGVGAFIAARRRTS